MRIFAIAVYHAAKYNTTIVNPCYNSPCSHLCLIVPNGHRCACPDNANPNPKGQSEVHCDAGKS